MKSCEQIGFAIVIAPKSSSLAFVLSMEPSKEQIYFTSILCLLSFLPQLHCLASVFGKTSREQTPCFGDKVEKSPSPNGLKQAFSWLQGVRSTAVPSS